MGQTILGTKHLIGPGGKGSNQAIAAARLGGNISFITKIGDDNNAEMALNLYKSSGVNTDYIIKDKNHSTGVAGIMINANTGDNAINIIPGAAGTLNSSDIDNNLKAIEKSDIFLTQLETPYDVTSYALQKAKDTGSITILNPAPASKISENDFKNIDYFTPNETEASFYLEKKIETKSEIENAAKEAGDAFNGAFSVALAKSLKIVDALEFSNKVAGISTTKEGAANSMPTHQEVEVY